MATQLIERYFVYINIKTRHISSAIRNIRELFPNLKPPLNTLNVFRDIHIMNGIRYTRSKLEENLLNLK